MLDAFIGLGSNLPDRLTALRRAVESLAHLGRVRARSALYETVFASAAARPLLNAALWLETALSPQELLERLCEIEAAASAPATAKETATDGVGPLAAEGKDVPLPLDLDLLMLGHKGDMVVVSPSLTVPHPRLHLRAFALRPLLDLAPALVHPALSLPLRVLYRLLPDESALPRPRGWL